MLQLQQLFCRHMIFYCTEHTTDKVSYRTLFLDILFRKKATEEQNLYLYKSAFSHSY